MAEGPNKVAGPNEAVFHSLASRLGGLAGNEELQRLVRGLAQQLSRDGTARGGPAPADAWADLDLISAVGAASPVAAPAKDGAWWRALLDIAPTVLVFVPILLTWLSLFAATSAYRSLEDDAAARAANSGKSFLELWQQGFDGRLLGFFSFGSVAIMTAVTVSLLIVTTALGAYFRRRDEDTSDEAHDRAEKARAALLPELVRAQAELNRHRLGTPARFAGELSQAAQGMRDLLARTAQTQENAQTLAEHNQRLAAELVRQTADARATSAEMKSATANLNTAATALAKASIALGTEVTSRVNASADRLSHTTDEAAHQVGDLIQVGRSSLDGITERFEAAMTGLRGQVERACAALSDAGQEYATAIAESSGQASADIGEVYRAAVESAGVNLATEIAQSTADLRLILAGVSQSADAQAAAARQTEAAVNTHAAVVTSAADRMAGAAAEISSATAGISEAVQSISGTTRAMSAPPAPDPPATPPAWWAEPTVIEAFQAESSSSGERS